LLRLTLHHNTMAANVKSANTEKSANAINFHKLDAKLTSAHVLIETKNLRNLYFHKSNVKLIVAVLVQIRKKLKKLKRLQKSKSLLPKYRVSLSTAAAVQVVVVQSAKREA